MFAKVSVSYSWRFMLYDLNDLPVTGLVNANFTKTVTNPAGGVNTVAITVSEVDGINAPGLYQVAFTPDTTGKWFSLVTNATHAVRGFVDEILVATRSVDELAVPGDAMDLVANAVDAAALAASALSAIQATILSDATPFAGANVDAAVSSRAAPGDAMALAAGALNAAAVAVAAANKLADHALRRTYANARASADGDALTPRSALGMVAKQTNKSELSAGSLKYYHEDDATLFGTQPVVATPGADPITTVNGAA